MGAGIAEPPGDDFRARVPIWRVEVRHGAARATCSAGRRARKRHRIHWPISSSAKLKVGYLVDYDLQTWRVTGYSRYRFSGVDDVEEWELSADGEQRYLERAGRRLVAVVQDRRRRHRRRRSAAHPRPRGSAGDHHLQGRRVPPRRLLRRAPARRKAAGAPEPVIRWEFVDADETAFVGIEQWGETEFTAAAGSVVEDYQFTHILPGSPT